MKTIRPILAMLVLALLIPLHSYRQDLVKTNTFIPRKNVIRYNLTPNIVGFKSVIFGYERVVKSHQSFSINAGYLSIGNSGKKENEEYKLTINKSNNGFSFAADYRFNLKKENKDPAHHGVYIAPYFAHYNLNSLLELKV